jgi:hypothetical protein
LYACAKGSAVPAQNPIITTSVEKVQNTIFKKLFSISIFMNLITADDRETVLGKSICQEC